MKKLNYLLPDIRIRMILIFLISNFSLLTHAQDKSPAGGERTFNLPAGLSSKDYLPNVVIVKFRTIRSDAAGLNSQAGISLKSAKVVELKKKFGNSRISTASVGLPANDFGLDRIYELKFSGTEKIEDVINELLLDEGIEYAEPSYIHRVQYTPNDPLYLTMDQPALNQVKANLAWDISRNSSGIVIAIVDVGSNLSHPDLAGNIYKNEADPINGIDDDNDGYTDNYLGWDFVGSSASTMIADNDPNVKSDSTEHGVLVSGVASAVSDNGTGIASIAFNAKLLIVKVGADDSGAGIYSGYDGIKYAADHGAKIINCAWAGPASGSYGQDIINYAISKNCLIIAAAGNNNSALPEYPAAYPGVFAIANVSSDDKRSQSSNFGSHISISAPGTEILTTSRLSYKSASGTSIAAPMVSSAAALVASHFPFFSMRQVAEQLRITADDIDGSNPGYTERLGKGRLNVHRALTEAIPSIRNQKTTIVNNGNNNIYAGDTLQLFFDLKNLLSPVGKFNLKLSSISSSVTVLTQQFSIASLTTMQTINQIGPFHVHVKPNASDNAEIEFKLEYIATDSPYKDYEKFILTVSPDYINVSVNQISTTMTSNGRIGYGATNRRNGIGFIYKAQQLLYETGLIVGVSPLKLSDNVRVSSFNANEHFRKTLRVKRINNPTIAFEGLSEFNDVGHSRSLNVDIKHRLLAYTGPPDDKYIIAEYEFINKNTVDLNGVYIGLYTDWDLSNPARNDATKYDPSNKMGYAFRKDGGGLYAGVKLLNKTDHVSYYPTSPGEALWADNDLSRFEKFKMISGGIKQDGLGENTVSGLDVKFTIGVGPFNIAANQSVKVAFALIAGESLSDLQSGAMAAEKKYNVSASEPEPIAFHLKQNYPNPVRKNTTFNFLLQKDGLVTLNVYNLMGHYVKSLINEKLNTGFHSVTADLSDLEDGIYFYKLLQNSSAMTMKLTVIK